METTYLNVCDRPISRWSIVRLLKQSCCYYVCHLVQCTYKHQIGAKVSLFHVRMKFGTSDTLD